MATLNATFLDDLGRVRLELIDAMPGVRYQIQRSTADDPAWVDVRGAQHMSTDFTTIIDDYEYTPNIVNTYRLVAPGFYDSFNRIVPVEGVLSLPGTSGSYASTPDHADLDVTGDFALVYEGALDAWGGTVQGLVSKWSATAGQRAYQMFVNSDGRLGLNWSPDGSATESALSSVVIPLDPGEHGAVRVRLDSDNGLGDHFTRFEVADTKAGPWSTFGSDALDTGTTSVFQSTAILTVGATNEGTNQYATGRAATAEVYSDFAATTVVADPDFTAQSAGTTSFVDSTGKTWTVQGDAEIIEILDESGTTWGTADTGQDWHIGGSSPGFGAYVDNGVGVIESSAPSGRIVEFITDPIAGAEDAEITWSAIQPDNSLDQHVEWNVGLRAADQDNFYESNLIFEEDANGHVVELRIGKFIADNFTMLSQVVEVGTWTPNIAWHVRFRVQGSTLQARAWEDGTDEPERWDVSTTDTDITSGTAVHVRGFKSSGSAYEQWFGPMELNTIPQGIADTTTITPVQSEVFLKSITYPLFNHALDCVDWQELVRNARTGFFDVKGRHEILGVADVGSSATFDLTFISRSKAENRAIVALLTYGGVMLLQPPGDDETIDCPTEYSGIPEGYVMVSEYTQGRTVYGKPLWTWTATFTRVAAADADAILPTTITWTQLWDIIGPDGTWEDVWATWPTWQALWLTAGNPVTFGALS